jgi:preprotein translocase subunit SecE
MFKNFIHNCKESYNELVHKTTWPSGKELASSAVVVLVASLMIAVVVYLMDECFQVIMTNIIYP